MRDGDYLEIRVHEQARGPVAIAALDIAALKHLLGSQLFLAQAQTLLRAALAGPDAKERIELLEAALPVPVKPIGAPMASRAARDRATREALRVKRRTRRQN